MSDMILFHILCLICIFFFYFGNNGSLRNAKKINLGIVSLTLSIMICCDMLWGILSRCGITNSFIGYTLNIFYFISAIFAIYFWLLYILRSIGSRLFENKLLLFIVSLPIMLDALLVISSPLTGYVFIIQNGQYERSTLLWVDTAVKFIYLLFGSVYSLILALKENLKYRRKKYLLLALYSVPVVLGGILQMFFSIDANCVAPVIGLAILYIAGVSNKFREDSDIMHALANSYGGAFIINSDTPSVRTLHSEFPELEGYRQPLERIFYDDALSDYITHIVLPEDRLTVEQSFCIENLLLQLSEKKAYTVVYRSFDENMNIVHNQATFMKAFSSQDRHLIFLGIDRTDIKTLLANERESLIEEKERFEKVKESFTNVIADIIEARDVDSGEHVIRVKNYTQYLCYQVMKDYPEYGLTPEKIRYIISGSALHDIGKIMIPDAILLKPDKLTPEEFDIMKTHCKKCIDILDKLPSDLDEEYVKYAKEICMYHHEKYDGKGYYKLTGDNIPISAQIVSIADCFDALTSNRVYKKSYPFDVAYKMILDGECGQFNPKLIDCLKKVYFDAIINQTENITKIPEKGVN